MSDERATAQAGWYPDPKGSGDLFYWDGSKWTGDVHRPVTSPSPKAKAVPKGSLGRGRQLILGGGIALAISPFLPWVKVVFLGDLTLFQLFAATGRSNALAWGAVIAGGTAAFVAWREGSAAAVRLTGLAVGALGGVLAVFALTALRHDIREASGLAAIGIGPYIAIGGCAAMIVG